VEGIGKLKIAEKIFRNGSWIGSFGGKNWANCTRATIDLINAALQFERKGDSKWFNNLIAKYNIVINEAHNGGKFLSKFMDNNSFDLAAKHQSMFCAKYGAQLYIILESLKGKDRESRRASNLKLLRNGLSKKEQQQFDLLMEKADKKEIESCDNCGEKCCLDICDEGHCAHCCNCSSWDR